MDVQQSGVVSFYDTHPINEQEILVKLRQSGVDPASATVADLARFDQDHYGGLDAVERLIEAAGIRAEHHVLDVCSGLGGPARWIAHRTGCRVTGLDLTTSRVESAVRLTALVGLQGRVDFVQGDAARMTLPDASVDVVVSEEAWCHVPDKPALIAHCARVLRPGGVIAFTDIVSRTPLGQEDAARLAAGMQMPPPAAASDYAHWLAASDCKLTSHDDLSGEWQRILVDRLAMYRSLRDTTVARFGQARFDEYDRAYAHFVGLFTAGVLGGARVVARRAGA
jgi:ubiquinone/menaquinone biosynthesis C-methylase UbiE